MIDVFAFVALGIQDVGGFFRDADADGKGAPRGGATLCKLVGAHWCKPLDRDAVGLKWLFFLKYQSDGIAYAIKAVVEYSAEFGHYFQAVGVEINGRYHNELG